MRLVPDDFMGIRSARGFVERVSAMQVVAAALGYFTLHFPEPIRIAELGSLLGFSEDCVEFSFDHVRGMTPAQALLDFRLNQLFQSLSQEPRQGLGRAVRACGLGTTTGVLSLFEQAFGIDMSLFLLTCRRAADDRLFRQAHPDAAALVLP